jgi:predicted NBD/HSP70 family sugar kinase
MKPFQFNQYSVTPLPLDPGFVPMILANRAYEKNVHEYEDKQLIKIAIKRSNGQISTTTRYVFPPHANQFSANYRYIERLVKTLLWLKGGYHIMIAGCDNVTKQIQQDYSNDGIRAFDRDFMANVYQHPFLVEVMSLDDIPDTSETSNPIGRHLEGNRIGFDAGGSDRKVSAVIDGKAIYSEEVVWFPKEKSDPWYHYNGIMDSIKRAAEKLPRVDAIGVSSAGIYIDNQIAVASLFRKVPQDQFDAVVRNMYINIAKEFKVPLAVANDGDVTALAGAMSLEANKVLGIAMGTSEAVGYVDALGNITGWLNELCFVPVDYNKDSMIDEWSGDYGCGVTYFSQDAVIKLAKKTSIELNHTLPPAEQLKIVQALHEENDPRAIEIFKTIGVYLGYTIAYYAEFYDIEHVLVLGRVTSKQGGERIVSEANRVLQEEFSSLYQHINVQLPDEKNRRVGQSIAAASLPQL